MEYVCRVIGNDLRGKPFCAGFIVSSAGKVIDAAPILRAHFDVRPGNRARSDVVRLRELGLKVEIHGWA